MTRYGNLQTDREVQYLSKEALNTTTINVNFTVPTGEICINTVIVLANSVYSKLEYMFSVCFYSKGKFVSVHTMKAYRSRGIAPLIPNLNTRWRRMVNFTLRRLYSREKNLVPIEEEAGWASEPV